MKRHYATHRALEELLKQYDLMPSSNDLLWPVNLANFTTRAYPLHMGLELGMKALIGREDFKTHRLDACYRRLLDEHKTALDNAWNDAVAFYGFDPTLPHLKHLLPLETYLKATGSGKRFEDYRYWPLGVSENDLNSIPKPWASAPMTVLELNRELLRYLSALIGGWGRKVGGPYLLTDLVEHSVMMAISSNTPAMKDYLSKPRAGQRPFTNYLKELFDADQHTAAAIAEKLGQPNCAYAVRHMLAIWTAHSDAAMHRPLKLVELTTSPYRAQVLHPISQEVWGTIENTGYGLYHLDSYGRHFNAFTSSIEAACSLFVVNMTRNLRFRGRGQYCQGLFTVTQEYTSNMNAMRYRIVPLEPEEIQGDLFLDNLTVGDAVRWFAPQPHQSVIEFHDGIVVSNEPNSLIVETEFTTGLATHPDQVDKDPVRHEIMRQAMGDSTA